MYSPLANWGILFENLAMLYIMEPNALPCIDLGTSCYITNDMHDIIWIEQWRVFPLKHQLKLIIAPISSVDYLSCNKYIHTHISCMSGYIYAYIHIDACLSIYKPIYMHQHILYSCIDTYIYAYILMFVSLHISHISPWNIYHYRTRYISTIFGYAIFPDFHTFENTEIWKYGN